MDKIGEMYNEIKELYKPLEDALNAQRDKE